MTPFKIAMHYLTIIPVGLPTGTDKHDYGKSFMFFPLAGFILGTIIVLLLHLTHYLPVLIRGLIFLISSVLLTGAFHLDGFADTCDGLYHTHSKEKALAVMKDSRIGVMGVIGLITLLLSKFILFISLPEYIQWKVVISVYVLSRWAQVCVCWNAGYPREEGTGKNFIEGNKTAFVLVSGIYSFIIVFCLMGLKGLFLMGFNFVTAFMLKKYFKNRVGGVTGDIIGAVNEIAETGSLFIISLLL